MRHLARQLLSIALVALALGASSLNGYAAALAAFDVHHHGGHSHDHGLHTHGAHDHTAVADPAPSDDDGPVSADKICEHMHVHCCAATAVPPADCSLKLGDLPREVVRWVASHIPPGEGVSFLFRPPRAAA